MGRRGYHDRHDVPRSVTGNVIALAVIVVMLVLVALDGRGVL